MKTLVRYVTCKIDKSIYHITNPLQLDISDDIMNLPIFDEKAINSVYKEKEGDEQNEQEIHQLLLEGEKALSLNDIIRTRQPNLEKFLYQLELKNGDQEEESTTKMFVKFKIKHMKGQRGHQLIHIIDMTDYVRHSELKSNFAYSLFKVKN